MYFKKIEPFSQDPSSGGGILNPPQPKDPNKLKEQELISIALMNGTQPPQRPPLLRLNDYVQQKLDNVVYCRYGLDYMHNFNFKDNVPIGSYKINLDQLIYHKQKLLQEDGGAFMFGRSNILTQRLNVIFWSALYFKQRKGSINSNASPQKFIKSHIIQAYHKEQQPVISPLILSSDPNESFNQIPQYTLNFDSVFESGNLALAIQVSETEYDLILQNDINTKGHTQFVSNFSVQTEVKFNILNLCKAKSLYQYGMKILVLDSSTNESNSQWMRTGENIYYSDNQYERVITKFYHIQLIQEDDKPYYSLSFTYKFPCNKKQMYFAHSIPYTYTMLNDYLNLHSKKRMLLCHTLAGNKCEYIHIDESAKKSSPPKTKIESISSKKSSQRLDDLIIKNSHGVTQIQKQVIFITSRVHPGESNSSWMMKGLMDMLFCPKSQEEKEIVSFLKEQFEFYIIPMLNVDGVINGNYRKNVFQYGNKIEALPNMSQKVKENLFPPKLFSHILSKQFDYFQFSDCSFSMPKSKESTARITMFQQLRIPFVFTLEASFAGANKGKLAGQHFSIGDFENVGKCVLKTIYQTKIIEGNKKLIRELSLEIDSQIVDKNEDGDDSGGDCSSEEDANDVIQNDPQNLNTQTDTISESSLNTTNTTNNIIKIKKKKLQKQHLNLQLLFRNHGIIVKKKKNQVTAKITSKVLKETMNEEVHKVSNQNLESQTEDNRKSRYHSKNVSIVSYFDLSEMVSPLPKEIKITSLQVSNGKQNQIMQQQSQFHASSQVFGQIIGQGAAYQVRNSNFLNDKISHKQQLSNQSQSDIHQMEKYNQSYKYLETNSQQRTDSPNLKIIKANLANHRSRSPLKGGGFNKQRNSPIKASPKISGQIHSQTHYQKTNTISGFEALNQAHNPNYSYINPLPILGTDTNVKFDQQLIVSDYDPMGRQRFSQYQLDQQNYSHSKKQTMPNIQSQTSTNYFNQFQYQKQIQANPTNSINAYYSDTSRSKQKQIKNLNIYQQQNLNAAIHGQQQMPIQNHPQIGVAALLSIKDLIQNKQINNNNQINVNNQMMPNQVMFQDKKSQSQTRKSNNSTVLNQYTSNFPEIHMIRNDNIWNAQRQHSLNSHENRYSHQQQQQTYQVLQQQKQQNINNSNISRGGDFGCEIENLKQKIIMPQSSQSLSPTTKMRNNIMTQKHQTHDIQQTNPINYLHSNLNNQSSNYNTKMTPSLDTSNYSGGNFNHNRMRSSSNYSPLDLQQQRISLDSQNIPIKLQ
eukprot:403346302